MRFSQSLCATAASRPKHSKTASRLFFMIKIILVLLVISWIDADSPLPFPEINIAADITQLQAGTTAIQLGMDLATADTFHIVFGHTQIKVGIHIPGYSIHLQIDSSLGRQRHIYVTADRGNGDRFVFADL